MRILLPLALMLLALGTAHAGPPETPAGKARYALTGSIETLDPPKAASEAARTCVVNLFDQLYEYHHLKRPYELQPGLAAAMPEISEDGLVHLIRLKPGVRFVDDPCFPDGKGRAVRAADVVFAIKRMMDMHTESPGRWMLERRIVGLDAFVQASAKAPKDVKRSRYSSGSGYPEVPGLEAVDAHTLRIRLLEPMPELPWLLASPWLSIYAPEAVRTYGDQLGRHAVGTGPFKLTLFLKSEKLLLQWNPGYREERYPKEGAHGDKRAGMLADAGRRLPLNALVEVTAHADPLRAWTAFQAGEADYAEIPRDSFLTTVDPASGRLLPLWTQRGVKLHRDPRLEIYYDAFNWEDPVVGGAAGDRGRAIRRAICLATDDEYAITRLYENQSERVFGPLLPEMRGYDPTFTNDWLRQPGESRTEALELAREELAEAGYPEGRGLPVLRMHIMDDKIAKLVFGIQQRQAAEIGIRIEAAPVSWKAMQAVLEAKGAQMWSSSWYADYPDAQNFLQLFYGPNGPNPNFCNYRNAEFDLLYTDARLLPPNAERDQLYREMQALVASDCPWRFRLRRIRWSASQSWLHGYRHNDIVQKYFKYCRADDKARMDAIAKWK